MGSGEVSMGNLKDGYFHFPFGKLWEMCPFPQKFPNKKCGEISSFFAVDEQMKILNFHYHK